MYYECRFCSKLFKRETSFLKHNCKERQRHFEASTIEAQTAYTIFKRWMYIKHKRNDVSYDTFKLSRTYNGFLKFAKYYRLINGLSNLDEFLKLMITRDIAPTFWLHDRVLSFYIDQMDESSPVKKVDKSIQTVFKICNVYECDTSKFFDNIEFNDMLTFIKLHKLSPWLLLNSKRFMLWVEDLTAEQQYIMDNIIDSNKWLALFKDDPKSVKFAKQCVQELEL